MNIKQYYPGNHKLLHHLDHLQNIVNGRTIAPIHVSIFPTIKCQLNCSYCCCQKARLEDGKKELEFDEFKSAIDVLAKLGTKAIEYSGGGESLLWSYYNESVKYLHNKNIKNSLITNGLALTVVPEDILKKITWIRTSIQSIKHAESIDYDHIRKFTRVSASYILANSKTFDENCVMLYKLFMFAKARDLVIRIGVEHPSTVDTRALRMLIQGHYLDHLFFAYKDPETPKGYYMPWVRACIDWKGNFLPCPGVQLNTESNKNIPDNFILCNIKDLKQWLINNPPRDMGFRCKHCNCGKQENDLIHDVLEQVEDVDFV